MIRTFGLPVLVALFIAPYSVFADDGADRGLQLELEAGPTWQTRNDVRIPNQGGTRFSMADLLGEGPYPAARLTIDWDVTSHHAVRAVFAPLEFDDSGELPEQVQFAGETFAPGISTDGTYNFSNYRIGYRYTFLNRDRWRLRFGGTLFVRDAEIVLQQGAKLASDSDVGVVPLLNFSAEYSPGDRWRIVADLDGAAASQGRAIDFSLKAHYDIGERASLAFGYRTIEGGADNDEVYTFAWIHSAVVSYGILF